jgi:predicted ferric reductase
LGKISRKKDEFNMAGHQPISGNRHNAHEKSGLKALRILAFCALAALLAAALAIPFYYQTETLWYKTGMNKAMLMAGQMAGLLTLVLLILQILLSLRGSFSEYLFGNAKMLRWHRRIGILIACSATCHALLILAPDGIGNLPFGKRYWPEMIGEGLFLLILATAISSHFRAALRFDYKVWRSIHKPLGYLILILVLMHVLFVSDSFKQGVPRIALITVFAGLALLITAVKTHKWRSKS